MSAASPPSSSRPDAGEVGRPGDGDADGPWPGLAVAGLAAAVALGVGRLVPAFSPLLVAVLLGVAAGNAARLPARWRPGLSTASTRLLRLGIVLLGLQLSLRDMVTLGPGVVAVAAAVVATGFAVAELTGRRLGLPPGRRLLIGAGMSICGAAAVAAVAAAIDDDDERDVVTAVALVVVFGTAMIALVPLTVGVLGLDPTTGGLWAGASVHEVAQVVAVGGILGATALQGAVVVKLVRVLMLAPVIAIIGLRRRAAPAAGATRPPLVPLFVLGFLAASVLRTTGLVPRPVLDAGALTQTLLLAAAMFALGCNVRVATLREVGARPVVLAGVTTAAVALVGLGGLLLVTSVTS